ncbi:MAG: hypothetical protein K2U26_19605 [Cyclobacteriaceae bacterium]|nr:hypothetical protein [Cyclobacteriaceae bacterium]
METNKALEKMRIEEAFNTITTIKLTCLSSIQAVFDSKESNQLDVNWRYLQTFLSESEEVNRLPSEPRRDVFYFVNYVVNTLPNELTSNKHYSCKREQNHFEIADYLTQEALMGEYTDRKSVSTILEILKKLTPEQAHYYFEGESEFDIMLFDLQQIETALKWCKSMAEKHNARDAIKLKSTLNAN